MSQPIAGNQRAEQGARPDQLLYDAPTGKLDRATAEGAFEHVLKFASEQGTAYGWVTHDARLAARRDRQLQLNAGVLA